ncbi:hypothetical protein [Paenibacillus sp. 1001270B_150601_E10]|uniref:hypothetical protein n=1 Tax=Paenibacillus sp. 1001270B_150601_E10 TaxID=2787079 RepID=UPI00189E0AB4|nr:hypothetical protein [Paenibacillus sp. 1001270B_150601_E10]
MAKTHRGKGLWKTPSKGRGTCPICLSTRIKLLYTVSDKENHQIKVCKKCKDAPADRVEKAVDTKQLAFRGKHRKQLHANLEGSTS